MTYVILVSRHEAFINQMNHYVSVFSQEQDEEIVSFSHQVIDQIRDVMKANPIGLLFFDIDDADGIALLHLVKEQFKQVLCIGVGRGQSAAQQSKLFTFGMDDYLSIPLAHELFEIRMKGYIQTAANKAAFGRSKLLASKEDEWPLFDEDDIEDFDDILKQFNRQILLMGKSDINTDDVLKLTSLLGKIQSRFMYLVATFPLAHALHDLSETIEDNIPTFIERSDDLYVIALSFVKDLIRWKDIVLIQKSEKPDFLNDSIIANSKLFASFLETALTDKADSIDDIFDF